MLNMVDPCIVAASPNKPNITFWVAEKPATMEDTFMPLIERVRTERMSLPRVIIYCRSHNDCATLYGLFRDNLGRDFTEPAGLPDLSESRLVDMFTSATSKKVRASILKVYSLLMNYSYYYKTFYCCWGESLLLAQIPVV